MRSPLYIILNGPSETGKSTLIARGLVSRLQLINGQFDRDTEADKVLRIHQDSFAAPMKNFIASTLGIKYSDLKKNTMMGIIAGYTPREFLIDLSENYIKGRYGDDAFARWLEHRTIRLDPMPDFVICDDGGFQWEYDILKTKARVIRCLRPGKTFEGDSRVFIYNKNGEVDYTLDNDGTVEELELKLDHLTNWCIDQLPENRRPPVM